MEGEANVVSRDLSCTFCDRDFTRPFNLKRHLKLVHNNEECDLDIKEEILKEFNTFSEFVSWKEEEEKMTMSKFVKQWGSKNSKHGDKVMYYNCYRSGIYKPKGKGVRRLKSQGSVKIGTSCPAGMKVKQTKENLVVHYFPKHDNHGTELDHLTLSQSDRADIAGISGNFKGDVVHSCFSSIDDIVKKEKDYS